VEKWNNVKLKGSEGGGGGGLGSKRKDKRVKYM
jgi:hypothetical protein